MNRIALCLAGVACVVSGALAGEKPTPKEITVDIGKPAARQASLVRTPLSFEPNVGQADTGAKFVAHGPGYSVQLNAAGARLQLPDSQTVSVDLLNGRTDAEMHGEGLLPGTANYFPTSDPKTWHANIPTYSKVRYSGVYPGIDAAFYGNAARLEYDFIVQPGASPSLIRMRLSGAEQASVNSAGDLVLRLGKGELDLLRPVAYQTAKDGSRRTVKAGYRLERAGNGEPAQVSIALGAYDRGKTLVIDPVVALLYAEYSNYYYVGSVAADNSGNSYFTGNPNATGFYVTKVNSSGVVVYTTTIGTGSFYPTKIALDSSNLAYVVGQVNGSGSTLPTGSNSYQSTVTASTNAFYVQIAANGASVPYATFLGGNTTSAAYGLGVDSTGKSFLGGYTYASTFPVTAGAYQGALLGGGYNGWVAKIDPTKSGSASLVYSTYLGPTNSQVLAVGVDSSDNAYAASYATSTSAFPTTSGAFKYGGYDSASGGAYVTKLNSTGTALVYSAYLGYGVPYGIAVEGQSSPSAYVTGAVQYADWPTTAGAYQTSYAGGFVTKLSADGSSEVYSTFLGGPSSFGGGYSGANTVVPWSIALPNGCASNCNAYVSGRTNTNDFPSINPIQNFSPAPGSDLAFVVEMSSDGTSALFSSTLSGFTQGVWNGFNDSAAYGFTPAIAVDSTGNMSVVGDLGGAADFPITTTITGNANTTAFLARIVPAASSPYAWVTPTAISFGNQPVGVSTAVNNKTATVHIRNLSAGTITLTSILPSPPSIFAESDNCAGSIAPGGFCTANVDFTPGAPGARSGTLTVASNASDTPVVTLSGTGYDTAWLIPAPSSLSFGSQNVGTASAVQTVTLTNYGDETYPMTISTGTANYTETNNCPSQLAPSSNCTINVTFTPTQVGLLNDTLSISGAASNVSLTGTGTTASAGTLAFSGASLDFGNEAVGATTAYQVVTIQNTGSVPVTIQSVATAGDFSIYSQGCSTLPRQLNPEETCNEDITFTPTATGTRTGFLTVVDSASGSPHTVALTGNGLPAVQNLEFYPATTVTFPDQPVGYQSGTTTVYPENTGTAPIAMYRELVSGSFQITYNNCAAATLQGNLNDGAVGASYGYCQLNVAFTPTATGPQTGTLTFIDSEGTQTVNLAANGIADTGTLVLGVSQLDYNTYAIGTTSPTQLVTLNNPGNTPITINSYSTGVSDFAVTNYNCPAVPFTLSGNGGTCDVQVSFDPTSASNPRTGTLTVASTAGNQTVSLSGNGVVASEAIGLTPPSPMNFGSVVVGQTDGANGNDDGQASDLVSIRNTGTSPVTFSANPTVTGTNSADFVLYNPNGCGNSSTKLAAGASCAMWINFKPSVAAAETATLTFTDDAPGSPQTMTLNGTGISTAPTYYLSNSLLNFDNTVQGATSPNNTFIRFYNNSGASVTMGNIAFTGNFLTPGGGYQTCNGQVIANGGSCYTYVVFSPASSGHLTGTVTFKNNGGTTLASAPLDGFAPAPVLTALLDPTTVNFASDQVVGVTTTYNNVFALTNTGNLPLTIGTLTGTNVGTTPTNEFTDVSNGCGGQSVNPGSACNVYVNFTPNATGARTGTVVFPVTYTGGTTQNFTENLAGTGIAEVNSAVLTPSAGSFVDDTVGLTTGYSVTVTLNNSGNRPFTVGTVAGTDFGTPPGSEFSDNPAQSGSDGCTNQTVNPGSYCQINVRFTPNAAGVRSGNAVFPVTFADHTTANPTVTFSGTGIGQGLKLQVTPASLQYQAQVQSTTSAQQAVAVKNIGNAPVTMGTISYLGDFVAGPSGNGCTGNLAVGSICYIYTSFAPFTTGARTGSLTINDNAANNPQTVGLSGTGIAANQQIAVSQTTVTFPSQPQSSISTAQVVYFTNQADTTVSTFSVGALGGTNPTDYQMTNSCPAAIGARTTCTISFKFTPGASATGTRTASVAITTSVAGETPITINLTGTAVVAGPAATLAPSPLTFPGVQNVGTSSSPQKFSVTNTGSANLTITNVTSTNSAEFAISADGCSGATLTPNTHCYVSVTFSPTLGGARTSTIHVTDNATGSPQSLTANGTALGIPMLNPNPTSLTFSSQNIGTTSGAQSVTLSNPGTDTLVIGSISLTGANSGDFAITANTCGGTLAPAGSCSVSVKFTPTAGGSRGAAITVTDNANNAPGSSQSVPLSGTGVAVPVAGVLPTTLAFGNQNVGSPSAAKSSTLSNSGTGPLTIASIVIGGTNPGDFSFAQTGNNCGQTLNNGANCSISVIFTPTVAGARSATVTVTDNSNNGTNVTQTITLTGTGLGVPGGSVTFTTLSFGNQNVGTTSAAQAVTFTNPGTKPLTITNVAVTPTGPFHRSDNCPRSPSTLAAGANCSINVTFGPTVEGAASATLTITDNANNIPGLTQNVALSGTGVEPIAAVSPGSLTFGNQNVGSTSASQPVTINNTGNATLAIASINFIGTNPTDFKETNNCAGNVAAGGSCTVNVSFAPTASGSRSATLSVNDNNGNAFGSHQNVTVSGTGQAPIAGVAPPSLAFGNQVINTTSASQPVTLSNTGTAPLIVTAIVTGTGYGQTNNCGTLPATVAAGGSCTINVTFTPTTTGAHSTNLTITDNNNEVTGSTQKVTLTGTGTKPTAALTPTSLSFASQTVGTSSASKPLTLKNSGNGPLTITAIGFGGTDPGDYSETDTCAAGVFPATLAAGASCTVNVTFTPTATGSRPATLVVTDNTNGVAGSTQSATLSGTGM